MSYATPADLRKWMMQHRVDTYLPGEEPQSNALMQQALDSASAEMDGYFQLGRYTVPISATGELAEMLKGLCMALAPVYLRLSLDQFPETMDSQVADARKRLARIRGLQGVRADGSYGFLTGLEDLPGLTRNP